jgi:monomeric sarcosine oxidase
VHDLGSSHGKTRVIRQAYFEHPCYVPLLQRAYQLWDELSEQAGQPLFVRTGLAEIGPADGTVIGGVRRSAAEHGLEIEELTMSEISTRWPGLAGRDDWQAVIETNAGFLRVEACVAAHLRHAVEAGAVCRHGHPIDQWRADAAGVQVTTAGRVERADHLVIAAGPWLGSVAGDWGIKLRVLRKHQYWLAAQSPGYELSDGFPCFFYETENGYFYGFPSLDQSGVKVARHSGGEPLSAPTNGPHPEDDSDRALVARFVGDCLPGVSDQLVSHAGCYYTTTADEHFIIGHHPADNRVTVIGGLSGHGFKFTSVLGEIASTLAQGKSPPFDLSLFRATRFG